jgi:hypothetical protein
LDIPRETPLDPDALDRPLVQFQRWFAVDHHDYAQFPAALGAERPGKGLRTRKAHVVFAQPADQALDQAPLPRLEIAKQFVSALAMNVYDLSGSHPHYPESILWRRLVWVKEILSPPATRDWPET